MTRSGPRKPIGPLLLLIGCALLLRGLIPAGWMPASSGDGFVLELCSGRMPGGAPEELRAARELLDAALAGAAEHRDKDEGSAKDQPCTFAAFAPAWAGPAAFASPPPPPASTEALPPALMGAVGRGLPAPPPPATGPPLHA
ncbi:hypothetical protein [Sphingosinicella sp. CPCC 101087]|uniref:hypothetical protein n=1 Tax=Sphingosinicella sp. CPCC 101087 TaxID=2497754 RepID=UPI00101C670B|nr:hypothetical protein [Sphingosinicella sp. CPCC 101087]